jgi:transposase
MSKHELTDAAWRRLAPLLPPQRPVTGRPARDHRTIVNAMLWLAKTGVPWRDLPERYGPWRTVATRFYRWTKSGLWQRILDELQREGDAAGRLDWSVHMVDGTDIRAHRHAAGAKGSRRIRRSGARGAASAASSACAASGADDRSPSS